MTTPALVVHVITRFLGAGAERSVADIINACDSTKYKHILIVGKDHRVESIRALCGDVSLIVVKELVRAPHCIFDIRAFIALKRILTEFRPDIVHTIESKAGILGRVAARCAGVPKIVHSSVIANVGLDIYPLMTPVYWLCECLVARWTDQFIVNGLDLLERNLKFHIGKREQYKIVRSTVDSGLFRKTQREREIVRSKLGLSSTENVILFAGHLDKRKGALQIPKYFRRVKKQLPSACLLIAGVGPYEKKLRSELSEDSITRNVSFLGFTEKLPDLMAAADCLIMLSSSEGMATVLVQSVAAGTPFVSYAVDGPKELLNSGAVGAVVGINDWRGAADQTLKMLSIERPGALDLKDWMPRTVMHSYRQIFDDILSEK